MIGDGAWVLLAAMVGLATSAIFSSWLRWERETFVLGYLLVAGAFLAAYAVIAQVRPLLQLRRRWRAGLVSGVLVGAVLAQGVTRHPASPRPTGAALAGALAWLGLVYGTLDAVLLTVVPVLAIYGSRPPELLRSGGERLRWGGAALAASLAVTAAYHLGFAEFRGASLVQPLIGNALVTAGYLMSGSALAPILAHVIMHGAAVLHGPATTVQLPPHY